jgi:xylosylprotein 4-beta-galactosyltransferase
MSKYSIIIPYRNRERHLSILLPKLYEKFKDKDFEIIISEQNDNDNFRIACVEDIGYTFASGDNILLHQVDYMPTNDVSYEIDDTPILPARIGHFVNSDFTPRPIEDVPAGYRKWSTEIDPHFYGGLILMKRHHFESINGLNPLYIGWGNEDEDLRERFVWANISVKRNEVGTFNILHHKDNCPPPNEQERYRDFMIGRDILNQGINFKDIGYKNLSADIEKFETDYPNLIWIKSTNYKIEVPNEIKNMFGDYWNVISH